MENQTTSGIPAIGCRVQPKWMWTARIANLVAIPCFFVFIMCFHSTDTNATLVPRQMLLCLPNLVVFLYLLRNPPAKTWLILSVGTGLAWVPMLPFVLLMASSSDAVQLASLAFGVSQLLATASALIIYKELGKGLGHWAKLLGASLLEGFLLTGGFFVGLVGGRP
jgi:hypothetical protein